MLKLFCIAVGGGIGSVLRYLITGVAQRVTSATTFPVGTLTVNVLGCLVIGALTAFFAGPQLVRQEFRLAIMIGLLGGFTTFSTFGNETLALLNGGQYQYAVLNVVLSNGLGLAAAWAGYRLGTAWFGA